MLYSRNALCRWDLIVLNIVSALALGGGVFDASHGGVLEAARLGGQESVRDSWVSEEVGVVRLGSKLVFCIARLEPEGEKGSLTRYWLV
jgi:hypothetical protein